MITYPKEIVNNRWDSMSESLREILSSPVYGATIFEIAEDHHLDEHKTKILIGLVRLVLYGFIHPEELDKKLIKETGIKKEIAKEIEDEIDRKIFSQFRNELSEVYSPIPESSPELSEEYQKIKEEEKEDSINIEGATGTVKIGDTRKDVEDKKIEISKEEPEKVTSKEEIEKNTKPFILSQDKDEKKKDEIQRKNVEKRKKSFSFATDGFFSSKKKEKESPKADVQAPGDKDDAGGGFFGFGNKNKKKKQEKIVHYSDNRTPLSEDGDDSFINLSSLKPSGPRKSSGENKINRKKNNQKESFIKRKPPTKNIEKESDIKKEDVKKDKEIKKIEKTVKKESQEKDNDSFLGNINITKNDEKIDQNKKKKDSDSPELDGNTVNLKNNNSSN